jgi:hypothetical protein
MSLSKLPTSRRTPTCNGRSSRFKETTNLSQFLERRSHWIIRSITNQHIGLPGKGAEYGKVDGPEASLPETLEKFATIER